MSELIVPPVTLPELRLMHEMGEREVHLFTRITNPDPYSTSYYRCKCGAESDRYGQRVSADPPLF